MLLPHRPSHLYADFSIRDLYAKDKLYVTWPANIYIEIYIYAQIYSELSFHDALNVLEQLKMFLYSISMLSLLLFCFSRLCLLSHPNQEILHANTRFHYWFCSFMKFHVCIHFCVFFDLFYFSFTIYHTICSSAADNYFLNSRYLCCRFL